MDVQLEKLIAKATNATEVYELEQIQSLWSGYGQIVRYKLVGAAVETVVVKHIQLPQQKKHPRGWSTDLSHERKVKSYEVEVAWYKNFVNYCTEEARIPKCLAVDFKDGEVFLVLEDLNSSGFPIRKTEVIWKDVEACLLWLANFHALFMEVQPKDLWTIGTYWHLETRPDELEVLEDIELKEAAKKIDTLLNETTFKTLVHGDAKLVNFCFSENEYKVAAVDFQYVGGGCGMKDVAYFMGSCLSENDCERLESKILDFYFKALKEALDTHKKEVDFTALENDWRSLYPVAWTDFHRFIKGWSPGHWKINSYSERLSREVVEGVQ